MALSLLLAYSLSMSISMQNFIVDAVSDTKQHQDLARYQSDSKTPELSVFPDLELLSDLGGENDFNFHSEKFKTSFSFSKHFETYTKTKDNQYLFSCVNIQPGLDLDALLYPFHTFS